MYIEDYFNYNRIKTQKISIGAIPLGGDEPIRIQSMTNTDTSDVEATVNQIIEITEAGADYVRLTVQTTRVAEKLNDIKTLLKKRGFDVPLIADIHFSPKAAELAAKIIEKVRINPGNYADLKQFKHIEYTDEEYTAEVESLKTNFIPLLNICKEHKTAIRIGTNHGSLSDRILSRYGDTPEGMTEATMEFLRICKAENFNDIVISMKASNPLVMIYANRFLVQQMRQEDMNFPLHLGVTEAGNDLEGRIKSAAGIGTLLADGIGDTVRVSLTESPAKEIPVAKKIVELFNFGNLATFSITDFPEIKDRTFTDYEKRKSSEIINIGGNNVPVVISDISGKCNSDGIKESGFIFNEKENTFEKTDLAADYLFINNENFNYNLPAETGIISENKKNRYNYLGYNDLKEEHVSEIQFIEINASEIQKTDFVKLKKYNQSVFILNLTNSASAIHYGRAFFIKTKAYGINNPIILKQTFETINDYAILKASAEIGALFIDGFGDGIMISGKPEDIEKANELSFGILQACRTRITKTEYISCPSCGRTLFNLEETTAKIKEKTAHLKGVKIAIMGCIVNGLGEMADADFGYVGTGTGKVTLYKNKEVIRRNIPENEAPDVLLQIIEQYS
ncbi:MAG: 4-hydroxy-3-methylbut-2-en-1-yl diphosphate synthase [Bacteroidetes bacterium]|nr:MAG: 4-hydroxy-3-methylbut-2-en-1-yl diphosphate synthase [Bacteroidota bacterium]